MAYLFSNHKKKRTDNNLVNEHSKASAFGKNHVYVNSYFKYALSFYKHINLCFITRLTALLLVVCLLVTAYPVIAVAGSIQNNESEQINLEQNEDEEGDFSENESSPDKGSISEISNTATLEAEKNTTDDSYSEEDNSPIEDEEVSFSNTEEQENETVDNVVSEQENGSAEQSENEAAEDVVSEQEDGSAEQSENATDQNNIDGEDVQTGTEYGDSVDSALSGSDDEQNRGGLTSTQLDENQFTQEGNEQQEILCEEELRLVQDGDFVTEHYGPVSRKMRSSSSSLRNLISEAMGSYQTEVAIADLGYTRTNDIDTVRSIYRSCIRGDRFYISGGFRLS